MHTKFRQLPLLQFLHAAAWNFPCDITVHNTIVEGSVL